MSSNAIDVAQQAIKRRLDAISDEENRLERALAELSGSRRRKPGRPRGRGTAGPKRKTRGRRKQTRATQALKIVEATPGVSAADVAKKMKMNPNYLYRVLGDLEKEKLVTRKGRKYFPKAMG